MAFVYTACTVCVTIFSTGSKFRPVSNFTELQLLLQLPVLTRSCILTSPLMQVCGPVRLISCPDPPPPHPAHSRRRGLVSQVQIIGKALKNFSVLSQKVFVYVRMRPSAALEEASCYLGESCKRIIFWGSILICGKAMLRLYMYTFETTTSVFTTHIVLSCLSPFFHPRLFSAVCNLRPGGSTNEDCFPLVWCR